MKERVIEWAGLSVVFYIVALALQILLIRDGGLYLVPVLASMLFSFSIVRRF